MSVTRGQANLIWVVTPASSRHRSRQDGGATPKLGVATSLPREVVRRIRL
jgi:hypothetical protein